MWSRSKPPHKGSLFRGNSVAQAEAPPTHNYKRVVLWEEKARVQDGSTYTLATQEAAYHAPDTFSCISPSLVRSVEAEGQHEAHCKAGNPESIEQGLMFVDNLQQQQR